MESAKFKLNSLYLLNVGNDTAKKRKKAWGWCTGMTQRDGLGREVGGAFGMGNMCIPMAD